MYYTDVYSLFNYKLTCTTRTCIVNFNQKKFSSPEYFFTNTDTVACTFMLAQSQNFCTKTVDYNLSRKKLIKSVLFSLNLSLFLMNFPENNCK